MAQPPKLVRNEGEVRSDIGAKLESFASQTALAKRHAPRNWEDISLEDQEYVRHFAEIKSSGSPATFRRYLRVIAQLLMWLNKPLNALSSRDLREYQVFLQNPTEEFQALADYAFQPASDKTVDDTFTVISLFCTFLHNEGALTNNPANNVKKLKRGGSTDETQNYFTPYKWQLFKDYMTSLPARTPGERNEAERLRYCVAIGYGLALRPDEMKRHHQGMIYRGDHGQYKIDINGKGNKDRTLVLDDDTVKAMQRYNQFLVGDERIGKYAVPFLPAVKAVRSRGRGRNKVYEILNGVSESAWQKVFKKHLMAIFAKEHGIPIDEVSNDLSWQKEWAELSPYSLRHTRLSHLLLRDKWEIIRVRDFAGHAHLSTTENYLHLGVVE